MELSKKSQVLFIGHSLSHFFTNLQLKLKISAQWTSIERYLFIYHERCLL